jgi:hypothetical protein
MIVDWPAIFNLSIPRNKPAKAERAEFFLLDVTYTFGINNISD